MNRQIRRIDDSIGSAPEFGYTFFFESNPIQDGEMWQKRVGAPGL
jgi:hypothetical protein